MKKHRFTMLSRNDRLNSKHCESGRSLLETLGVLAILALLTIGGIKGFGMLGSSASAKNLLDRVLDVAVMRSHDFLNASGRAPKSAAHVTFDNAPLPLSVENGVDGALENVFWVTLESVPMKTCAELLKEKQKLQNSTLPLIDISVNGSITQNCVDTNEIKFFFQKDRRISTSSSSISVTPRKNNGEIEVGEDEENDTTCPTITCPAHATCSDDTVTCLPGYTKEGCNTCHPQCVACSGNTYQSESDATCSKTCDNCGDAQQAVKSHTECADIARGNNCVEGGISDGDGRCVTCLDDDNCEVCQNCSDDHMSCDSVPNTRDRRGHICGPSCTEVECIEDTDCGICKDCSGNNVCEAVTNTQDSRGNICDENGSKIECLHNYAFNEVGACTDLAKPICSNGVCEACPAGAVYLQDQLTCGCPDHATCSNGTIRCQAGYFKNESGTCTLCGEGTYSAEGATSCTPCGAGSVGGDHTTCDCYQNATKDANGTCACNENFTLSENLCVCQAGYSLQDGVCTPCEDNTISKANGQCMDCGAGTANSTHTDCNCYTNATQNEDTLLCSCDNEYPWKVDNSKTCVQCTEYSDCGPQQYCSDNICTDCPTTTVTNCDGLHSSSGVKHADVPYFSFTPPSGCKYRVSFTSKTQRSWYTHLKAGFLADDYIILYQGTTDIWHRCNYEGGSEGLCPASMNTIFNSTHHDFTGNGQTVTLKTVDLFATQSNTYGCEGDISLIKVDREELF